MIISRGRVILGLHPARISRVLWAGEVLFSPSCKSLGAGISIEILVGG